MIDVNVCMYSGYDVPFVGAVSWSFDIDFDKNVIFFSFDDSSLSYSNICKQLF